MTQQTLPGAEKLKDITRHAQLLADRVRILPAPEMTAVVGPVA